MGDYKVKTVLIGAGSDLGEHIDGSKFGPSQLLNDIKSSYKGEIISFIQDDKIIKNRNLSDRRKNEYEINQFNTKIYHTILEQIKKGFFPITIGGDSSVSIASSLASSTRFEDMGMIYISAHADFHTFKSTISGNINGLSCAAITGYECAELRSFHTHNNGIVINPKKTVIVGARNIERLEKDNLRYSGATCFTTEDLLQKGIESVMEEAFKIATDKTNGVHIVYNMDIFDPDFTSGVSIPEVDGITIDNGMKILNELLNRIHVIESFDIVELNPLRDIDRKTEQVALNILANTIQKVEKYKNMEAEEKKY